MEELLPSPPSPPDDGLELTHIPEFCISEQQLVSCVSTYEHTIPNCVCGLGANYCLYLMKHRCFTGWSNDAESSPFCCEDMFSVSQFKM